MADTNISPEPKKRQADEQSAAETLPKLRIFGRVGDPNVRKTATLRLVSDTAPLPIFGRVPPRKPKNTERRKGEHPPPQLGGNLEIPDPIAPEGCLI